MLMEFTEQMKLAEAVSVTDLRFSPSLEHLHEALKRHILWLEWKSRNLESVAISNEHSD